MPSENDYRGLMTQEELREIAVSQEYRSQEYAEARKAAGKAKVSLDLLLTASLGDIQDRKKNVGIEMAYLMLCEPCWVAGTDKSEVARGLYREWQEQEAIYKGLERIIEAHASRLMFEMAIMKYNQIGERYGK